MYREIAAMKGKIGTASTSAGGQPKRKRGNQTVYTPELAAAVCEKLKRGGTLRAVCREAGMPPESTVREGAADDPAGFAAQYAPAREIGYHSMFDQLLDIAD